MSAPPFPTRQRRRAYLVIVSASVVCLLSAGSARAACWIDRERPATASQLPVTSPRVAATREAAHAVNRMLKANAALQALPDVRLRSTWQVTGHPDRTGEPYGFSLVLWAHGPEAWAGDCDLKPTADRGTPRAALVVHANAVTSTLKQRPSAVRDDQLEAFVEPEPVGKIGPHTVYGGQWIVLTADGRLPWVPVTMEEYLAFEERRLVREAAETDRTIGEARANAGALDEPALRKMYDELRKTNPAEAEKFRAMMEDVRKEAARAAAAAPPVTNASKKALDDLRAFRATLSATELQAQAREGQTSLTPRAPIQSLPRLVKLAPSSAARTDPTRILVMEVHFSGLGSPYEELMRQAAETIDWAALAGLMR